MPSQHIEILVGSYTKKNDTSVVVWKSKVGIHCPYIILVLMAIEQPLILPVGSPSGTAAYDSFARRLLTGIIIYLIFTSIEPLLMSFSNVKDISVAVQRVWQSTPTRLSAGRKGSWL